MFALKVTIAQVVEIRPPLRHTAPTDMSCFHDHDQAFAFSLLYCLEIRTKRKLLPKEMKANTETK